MAKTSSMAENRSRRFYLGGGRKGEVRPSRRARASTQGRKLEGRTVEMRGAGADSQRLEDVAAKEGSSVWCVGQGYRDSPSGVTRYDVDSDGEHHGELMVLSAEEVSSGRRWFRVPFPDGWMARYTKKGRDFSSLHCLDEYGKEFVEYQGGWYEAREVRTCQTSRGVEEQRARERNDGME